MVKIIIMIILIKLDNDYYGWDFTIVLVFNYLQITITVQHWYSMNLWNQATQWQQSFHIHKGWLKHLYTLCRLILASKL